MLGQRLMILKGLQYGRPHNNFDVSAVMNPGFLHWSRGERGGVGSCTFRDKNRRNPQLHKYSHASYLPGRREKAGSGQLG
jgi:hypothetical protein